MTRRFFVGVAAIILIACALITAWYMGQPSQKTLSDDIFAEKGFRITNQQQNITSQFTLQPAWIPAQIGENKAIHKVFYQNHETQIYVDSISLSSEGDVNVLLNSSSTFFKGGGIFVSPIVVVQRSGSPDVYTSIAWHSGGLTKEQIPRFANATTHQQFILNFASGAGPGDELMFTIRAQDVKRYFLTPVLVTIPDFNLITYVPDKS